MSDQYLYFRGYQNKEVLLFRIEKNASGGQKRIPLSRLWTNTKVLLPKGHYAIANQCSVYEFDHGQQPDTPTIVYMSRLQLRFAGRLPTIQDQQDQKQPVPVWCANSFLGKSSTFDHQTEFDVLPGSNTVFVSGNKVAFQLNPKEFKDFQLSLSSLSLVSAFEKNNHPFFATFVLENAPKNEPVKKGEHVLSAPINGKMWVHPGKYHVEVNGTDQQIELKDNQELSVALGALRVASPPHFPAEKRLQSGVQPIFININADVLYQLDTDYVLFPGEYTLNMNNSRLSKKIKIEADKQTTIQTYGALVQVADCPEEGGLCRNAPNVTIHIDKEAFDAMTLPVGVPFLVFDGSYQYGIEGFRGILKSLSVSRDDVGLQKLVRVKIDWKKTPTAGHQRTNFVRFESHGNGLMGKSLDLMFSKPNDVYLPEGNYLLTYYTTDMTAANPQRARQEVSLLDKQSANVTIPVYTQGVLVEPKEIEIPDPMDKPVLKAIQ